MRMPGNPVNGDTIDRTLRVALGRWTYAISPMVLKRAFLDWKELAQKLRVNSWWLQ
jgi:hypothetical protein